MSRRYGRNQKRKHAAKIKELEEHVNSLQGDYLRMTRLWRSSSEYSENLLAQLKMIVSAVNNVCRNSGCVEAEHVPGLVAHDLIHVPIWEELDCTILSEESPTINAMTFKTVDLYKLALSIRKYAPDFGTKIHLRAGSNGSVWYYASKELLQGLPDMAVQELSKDIAKLLIKELRTKEWR